MQSDPENAGRDARAPDYSESIRAELNVLLDLTPPGMWAELGLCPGPFGCPYASTEEAIAAGVEKHFCPGCRVIRVYRPL